MWCVAELNDAYIAKMEDVLETYVRRQLLFPVNDNYSSLLP